MIKCMVKMCIEQQQQKMQVKKLKEIRFDF